MRTPDKKTAMRLKAVEALMRAGFSRAECVMTVGISLTTLRKHLGPGQRGAQPDLELVDRNAQIAELFKCGKTLEEIGIQFGVGGGVLSIAPA